MKKNIVVCCEEILKDIADQRVALLVQIGTGWSWRFDIALTKGGFGGSAALTFCPRCGSKLPFPYEEPE